MSRAFLFFLFLFLIGFCSADDGIINSYGGNLFISKESNIKMSKEILVFTKTDTGMFVQVDFTFYNPGKARTDTVGFITPPYMEPGMEDMESHPNISYFIVNVNCDTLPFKTSRLSEMGFSEDFADNYWESFAYYFVVNFKPGDNFISHSYLFQPSVSAIGLEGYVFYNYKLTTGKNWAGSKIDSFECRINFNKPFTVQKSLDNSSESNWKVLGDGRTDITDYSGEVDTSRLFVNLSGGSLVYKAVSFSPEKDINIVEYHPIDNHPLLKNILFDTNKVKRFTPSELRYARNALFAIQGYVFKSKELQDHFSNYFWYTPDPKISANPSSLPEIYKEILEMIKEYENN